MDQSVCSRSKGNLHYGRFHNPIMTSRLSLSETSCLRASRLPMSSDQKIVPLRVQHRADSPSNEVAHASCTFAYRARRSETCVVFLRSWVSYQPVQRISQPMTDGHIISLSLVLQITCVTRCHLNLVLYYVLVCLHPTLRLSSDSAECKTIKATSLSSN